LQMTLRNPCGAGVSSIANALKPKIQESDLLQCVRSVASSGRTHRRMNDIMATKLQERRRADLANKLNRAVTAREDAIDKLCKADVRVRWLRKQLARYDRAIARVLTGEDKPAAATPAPPEPPPAPPAPPETPISGSYDINDLLAAREAGDIPEFLRRTRSEAQAKAIDADAAAKLKAEQAELKKAKARGRIERMKAKQRGDLKRMPLTGKDALAAIRGE
jgi:hypothetical protein